MAGTAGAIRAGRAFIELFADDSELQDTLRRTQRRLRSFADGVRQLGVSMTAIGGALSAPFIAGIRAASNMEEVMGKFNTVFGESSQAVREWANEFGAAMGRSQRQIAETLSSFQDLFVPLGFASDEATELSKVVTQLSVDLASFNNQADADTLRDLQAAITGSGEVMKKYGVVLTETATKQQLLNEGLDPRYATNQQKVLARLNIIVAATGAAHGDAARTSESFANQMKALWAATEDTAVALGTALLPVVTPLLSKTVELVGAFAVFATQNETLVKTLAAVAAAVGVAGVALVGLSVSIYGVSTALTVLAKHPYLVVFTVLATAAAALTAYFVTLEDDTKDLATAMGEMESSMASALDRFKQMQAQAKQGPVLPGYPTDADLRKVLEARRKQAAADRAQARRAQASRRDQLAQLAAWRRWQTERQRRRFDERFGRRPEPVAVSRTVSSGATFSAAAVAGLAATPIDKVVENTDETNELLRENNRITREAAPQFS